MKNRFILGLILLVLISAFSAKQIFAQLSGVLVYPSVVELNFSENDKKFVSKAVQVENPSNKTLRVRSYLEDWNLDKYGKIIFLEKPDKSSLASYVKFNPKEFELAPGQKQLVRITAKLPEGIDGEFRSIIFFETVNPKEEILQSSKSKVNISINFKTRYGVALYAYKGKISRNAAVENLNYEKSDNSYIVATLKNSGNVHSNIEGSITLIPASSSNVVTQPIVKYTILPENTQKYKILLPDNMMETDNYSAILKLNYKDIEEKIQVLESKVDFNYKAVKSTKKNLKKELLNPSAQKDESIDKIPGNIARPFDKQVPVDLNTEIRLK